MNVEEQIDWEALLAEFRGTEVPIVTAHTIVRVEDTYTQPFCVACDDDNLYWVKGVRPIWHQMARAVAAEHIVSHLGTILGAPVPTVAQVFVGPELVPSDPELPDHRPGVMHGSLNIEACSDRLELEHYDDTPENRARFARIAVLHGLCEAHDRQFHYSNVPPHLVFTIDHDHFFPGEQVWDVELLERATSLASPCRDIVSTCGLNEGDLQDALRRLDNISAPAIARVVSLPPDEWGLTTELRVAIARFLYRRKSAMAGLVEGR